MSKKYDWTEDDKQLIRDKAGTLTDVKLAEELGKRKSQTVNVQSVRKLRQSLGIYKKRGRGVCEVVQEKESVGTTTQTIGVVTR